MNEIDVNLPFQPLHIAVLTISDSRNESDDQSGDLLVERLLKAGHHLAARAIVKDEVTDIRQQIKLWAADAKIDVIITTGGTGLTGRDVTPEAVEPLLDKKIDGFSTLFHLLSYQTVGRVTIQSRAIAGLMKATFIFCLPGSSGACKDAWDGILQGQLDSRQQPSNFVDLIPRLIE